MKLLVTAALGADQGQLDELRALGHDVVYVADEQAPLPEGASEAEGIVCNALFLHHDQAQFANLTLVQLTSAGLDRAPVADLEARGVTVFNARGVYSVPIAEWVVMQVLQIAKHASFFHHNQAARKWEKQRDLTELAGRTACIVGFGDVGQEVAKRLRAFGVRIIGVRQHPAPSALADEVVGPEGLDEALASADFVVLTVPLTPSTHHLLNERRLAMLKDDAMLVNVARGAVIDEEALVAALEAGRFAGVALDVFEREPLDADSPLWGFDRCLVTPHNSFVSDRNARRLFAAVLTNLTSRRSVWE
ncbi:D-2-hydroxyacid dehydrogenase [Aestuariimicrobium sp. Y1814]|uniref:D-2-hydroxyacid dehydrogenase n=1 Tax=Aestuariimicrobium sp. Y1814 TaxID=3418742 RepID=UPI003DA76839